MISEEKSIWRILNSIAWDLRAKSKPSTTIASNLSRINWPAALFHWFFSSYFRLLVEVGLNDHIWAGFVFDYLLGSAPSKSIVYAIVATIITATLCINTSIWDSHHQWLEKIPTQETCIANSLVAELDILSLFAQNLVYFSWEKNSDFQRTHSHVAEWADWCKLCLGFALNSVKIYLSNVLLFITMWLFACDDGFLSLGLIARKAWPRPGTR